MQPNTMSQTELDIIISGITVLISVLMSAFVAGLRVGEMRGDMKLLARDLAEIKGMFVLKLRDDQTHDQK